MAAAAPTASRRRRVCGYAAILPIVAVSVSVLALLGGSARAQTASTAASGSAHFSTSRQQIWAVEIYAADSMLLDDVYLRGFHDAGVNALVLDPRKLSAGML